MQQGGINVPKQAYRFMTEWAFPDKPCTLCGQSMCVFQHPVSGHVAYVCGACDGLLAFLRSFL
jgi:hypothetical protein